MAEFIVEGTTIVVYLTLMEKLATFRAPVRIPRSAIGSAAPINTPFQTLRGIRSPGIFIPSKVAAGVWRHREGKDLLLIHGRHREAVVLELTGHAFQRVVVSDDNPRRILQCLHLP